MPASQQLQVCGIIAQACAAQNNLLALPAPQTETKKIFQCEEGEDEVLVATGLEQVFLGGIGDCKNIILDTGSSHCLIGRHLMPALKKRLLEAGEHFKPQPAKKRFQFGGRNSALSTEKVIVPLVLGRTLVQAEVYVVENEIPFLLGGRLLRQQKTEISVSENKMTVNNVTIQLVLMKSGHMAIPWTTNIHKLEDNHNNVFISQRVPRKEWSTPEVK
jgi:hypothetical protein